MLSPNLQDLRMEEAEAVLGSLEHDTNPETVRSTVAASSGVGSSRRTCMPTPIEMHAKGERIRKAGQMEESNH